jgi:hypothetical protein
VAVIGSVLTSLAALNVPAVDAGAAAAITAFISACVMAWTTRPAAPALFTGVVTALAALLVEYGLNVPDATVAAVSSTVLAGLTLITRGQVEPKSRQQVEPNSPVSSVAG